MAAKPPALPGTADSPVDRALALLMDGENEAALRWVTPLLSSNPAGATGLFLAGRLLAALGRSTSAFTAYDVCLGRAIDSGNLALAVAACRDLAQLQQDVGARLDEVAATFARDSARIAKGALPPSLPGAAGAECKPLPNGIAGEGLLAMAVDAVDQAAEKLELARSGGAVPKIGAQALFSSLGREALRGIIGVFDVLTVRTGQRLITQGELGAEAYVVGRGELTVTRNKDDGEPPALLARLGAGALFGEMSLLSRSPRAADVTATRPSIVLVARKESLDAIAATQPTLAKEFGDHCRRRMVENLVRHSPILGAVEPSARPALIERFVTRSFEQGEQLIVQGQQSDGLHLIASGEVAVVHREGEDSTVIAKVGMGEVVGEVALILRRPSNADVVASLPTITLHLPHERFMDLIKAYPTLLAELYQLAVARDDETKSLVAAEATDVDDMVLV